MFDITNQFPKEVADGFQVLEEEDIIYVYYLKSETEKQFVAAFWATAVERATIEKEMEGFKERRQVNKTKKREV